MPGPDKRRFSLRSPPQASPRHFQMPPGSGAYLFRLPLLLRQVACLLGAPRPPTVARPFPGWEHARGIMRFKGTKDYVATDDLKVAVNAAITLQRPLLVKGEPGTGKTVLAMEVAKAVKAPLIEWHIKSTTKAQQGLYEYDAVSRLRDSQLGDERVKDIAQLHPQGQAVGGVHLRRAPRAADRRDRQGRHRVPQRPVAGARPHGVLRLRDRRDHQGHAPPDRASSPPTTRRSCPTPSCAAASSTTSSSPMPRPCARSWRCTSPT